MLPLTSQRLKEKQKEVASPDNITAKLDKKIAINSSNLKRQSTIQKSLIKKADVDLENVFIT